MILLIYVLKMLSCSAVLTAYYYFFLRNRSFHAYNRFFVLLIFPLSILLPFIRLPYILNVDPSSLQVLLPLKPEMLPEVVLTFKTETSLWGTLLPYLLAIAYSGVAIYFAGKIFQSVIYLIRLTRKFPSTSFGNIKLFFTNEPATPFSFFNWIFWNNKLDSSSAAGRQVLQHELTHVKAKHSRDLLFVECLMAICWFNPFFYYLRKELKAIHEFLADQAAMNGTDNNEYAELLLLHAIAEKKHQLTHPFFHNQIKRRIIMITQMKKTSFAYTRRLMCLPVMLMVCIACSRGVDEVKNNTKHALETKTLENLKEELLRRDTIPITPAELEAMGRGKTTKNFSTFDIRDEMIYMSFKEGPVYAMSRSELQRWNAKTSDERKFWIPPIKKDAVDYDQTFTHLDASPTYPGGVGSWMRFLNKNFHYPDEAVEREVQGTVVTQFTIDKDGTIGDVQAISGPALLKPEAVRVIKLSGRWNPGIVNGQKVKAYHKQPITFRLQSE